MLKTIKIMLGLLCLLSGCAAKTTISDSLESLPVGFYEGAGFLVDHDRRLVLINTGQGWLGQIGVQSPLQRLEEEDGKLRFTYENEVFTLTIEPGKESYQGSLDHGGQTSSVALVWSEPEANDLLNFSLNASTQERMELLIKYQKYAPDGKVPAYQFDLGKDPQASAWLDQHQLDEVLSGKTDVELMKAGLSWVCGEYDHSSYSQYRGDDSLDRVGVYAATGKGLNCNNLSVLLSGILRSYGVKAVPVWCLSASQWDQECHVVVQAYSEQLDQWIFLDPTYNLMLMDEQGNYIGVEVLRSALIEGRPLTANPEANYNGEAFVLDDYRDYMTKNTFRFKRPAVCGREISDFVYLIPVNTQFSTSSLLSTDWDAFWATPEKDA